MKKVIALLLCTLAATAAFGAKDSRLVIREDWAVRSSADLPSATGEELSMPGYSTGGWYPTRVPATVLAVLTENGVYPDPFYGDNLTKVPGYQPGLWLVMKEDSPFHPAWWYRAEFSVPSEFSGKQIVLHLDGVNFEANVWMNGKRVADTSTVRGMFRRFEFDVNGLIKPGETNAIAIEIFSPGHIEDKNYRTKQVEATTGWDDHNPQPPDLNMGIWRDVYLTATGAVALRHPYVETRLDLPDMKAAHLTVEAHAMNKTDAPVSGVLSGVIESIRFEKAVNLGPRETQVVRITPEDCPQLNIENPRVWWPVDLGPQELYDARLEFTVDSAASDTASVRFGIREATTYINDEGWRGYMINGQKVLIRGGAWMTCDMMLRLDRDRYEALVRYAREGHLNMLRSEGFSVRETEDFYELCDQYGIMVTQQIFGRSLPDEALAVACIEDMMLRIRSHPSLVHFLGHDETFPTESLDQAYRGLIEKHNVNRTYQPHSGAFDIEERFETGGTRTGSLQVWTYAPPNHYYISEETGAWGFAQSGGIGGVFATLESLHRMMPEEALWPPFTDTWSLHTVTQGAYYFAPVLQAINDRYGRADTIEDFIKKGLALNYECARGMFEAYGRNKFSATGITTWKYDAAWPAAQTWQYIDWYLIPTGAYYGAKKACEPLHVQYSYDDNSVWVVNNYYRPCQDLEVTARVLDFGMAERFQQKATVSVDSNGKTEAFRIEMPGDITKTHFLTLELRDTNNGGVVSENFYWLSTIPDTPNPLEEFFAKPKSTSDYTMLNDLQEVDLEVTTTGFRGKSDKTAEVTLTNPTDRLAFSVQLAVTCGEGGPEVAPAYWSDNFVSLLPGQSRTITVTLPKGGISNNLPYIKVHGWNVKGKTVRAEHVGD